MRNNNILVSVIIPVYNVEIFLEECLVSIMNQTLKDIEIICIDDKSTDNSLSILEDFAKIDNRIKIIMNKENFGAGISRNNGISIANGEFIAFMDPDDFYPNNYVLEKLYHSAIKNKSLICGGNCIMISNNISDDLTNEEKERLIIRQKREQEHNIIFYKDKIINSFEYNSSYCYWRFIYKTNFLRENNITFPYYRRFQDPPFLANVLTKNIRMTCLKIESYIYRINHKITNYNFNKYYESLLGNADCIKIYSQNKMFNTHLTLIVNDFFERIMRIQYYINIFEKSELILIGELLNNIFNTIDYTKLQKSIFKIPNKNLLNLLKKFIDKNNYKNFLLFIQSF